MIGGTTAFIALAATTAAALALATRFGMPTALMGLAGGFAAPILVDTGSSNIPVLSAYLALILAGLGYVSTRQKWPLLGILASIGGLIWTGALVALASPGAAGVFAIGVLAMSAGIALPMATAKLPGAAPVRPASIVAGTVATLQVAALAAISDATVAGWSSYLVLSAALIWIARRDASYRRLVWFGGAVVLTLLFVAPPAGTAAFALVGATAFAVYAGDAVLRIHHGKTTLADAVLVGVGSLGVVGAGAGVWPDADGLSAGLAVIAAVINAAVVHLWHRRGNAGAVAANLVLLGATGLAALMAAFYALASLILPVATAVIAIALLLWSRHNRHAYVDRLGTAFALLSTLLLLRHGMFADEGAALTEGAGTQSAISVLKWAAIAAAATVVAAISKDRAARLAAGASAAVFAYGTAAILTPVEALPLVPAILLTGGAFAFLRMDRDAVLPALAMMGAMSALWAFGPVLTWSAPALAALLGEPMLVGDVPTILTILTQLLLPSAAVLAAAYALGTTERFARFAADLPVERLTAMAVTIAAAVTMIGAHSIYKSLFAIDDLSSFSAHGLAERSLWAVLLGGIGMVVIKYARTPVVSRIGAVTAAAGTAHAIWFSVVLHNPLWAEQALGSWPLLNLAVPLYLAPVAAAWVALSGWPDAHASQRQGFAVLVMTAIPLFVLTSLTQVFHGSIIDDVRTGITEDLLRSVAALALAIGYLVWGVRTRQRVWRLGSLVLMLIAVAKVFLLDAAGLEGLARIASFVALGGVLIAMGWVYSRYLPRQQEPETEAEAAVA
ncbi:MAG: DUF2339 domain-containing protein [Pseudomonadota bacterium]